MPPPRKEYLPILPPLRLLIRQPNDPILPPLAQLRALQPTPPFQAYVSDSEEDSTDNGRPGYDSEGFFIIDSTDPPSDDPLESSDSSGEQSDLEDNEPPLLPLPPRFPPPAPLPRVGGYHDPGARLQALSLWEYGVSLALVANLTKISEQHIRKIKRKALKRGYDPDVCKVILLRYVEDDLKTGRPAITETVKDLIIKILVRNSSTRAYSCQRLAFEVGEKLGQEKAISARTVFTVLKKRGYGSCKQTVKPGLTKQMKKDRWAFCLKYKDWTKEDWRNVIFTDETSV
jgi:hypothetical protein